MPLETFFEIMDATFAKLSDRGLSELDFDSDHRYLKFQFPCGEEIAGERYHKLDRMAFSTCMLQLLAKIIGHFWNCKDDRCLSYNVENK